MKLPGNMQQMMRQAQQMQEKMQADIAQIKVTATAGGARERLHTWLHEKGNAHLADAVENASIAVVGGDLNVVAPKSYALYFKDPGFDAAVSEVFGRPLRLKLTIPEAGAGPSPVSLAAPPKTEAGDDVTGRALAHPEVRRFREVFGGEVRKVRNLKE